MFETARKREGRPSICLYKPNDTHHRAVMWDMLYSSIQLPDSLRGLYQINRDTITWEALVEMNDPPPRVPLPSRTISTTSPATAPTVASGTTEPQMGELPLFPNFTTYLIISYGQEAQNALYHPLWMSSINLEDHRRRPMVLILTSRR